ncbi:MAG: carbamoyltransferase [Deltaproteobacteria bacterium]|nr:carbamoyltransferase [Deltaproteobacteria bacterium]
MTYILGISAYYHDSAACLVRDGKIIAAAQEERFSRKKHDPSFPGNAILYCLAEAGITPKQIDFVAFYDKPFLKFERLLETYLAFAPSGFCSFLKAMPIWIKEKIFLKSLLAKELNKLFGPTKKEKRDWEHLMLFPEHHQSHAASAFFPSPFKKASVLTVDGVGEWATASIGRGIGNKLELLYELHFPHSVGLLYSAFTYYTGFKVNSAEYKVMGLAPYGEPRYVDAIYRHLIDLKEDGSLAINMEFMNYCKGLTMTNEKFDRLFGGPPRRPESEVTQREMDLARSVQEVVEEIILRMARFARKETGEENLCMAGGVALNCVANGKLLRQKLFKNIWIQPAATDAGGALGAALAAWYQYLDNPRISDEKQDQMQGAFLGPSYSNEKVEEFLKSKEIPYRKYPDQELSSRTADILKEGKVVGWFQGRTEFGPRALGGRSILGDARNPDMQSTMNLKIKFRESFRPFAPSVLREQVQEFFEIDCDSPYMLLVAPVKEQRRIPSSRNGSKRLWGIDLLNQPRSDIPAITHIDYSARIQTVDKETNPRFYNLIKTFGEKTGTPVLVNTSFNVRGEPIVCSPEDAYLCFMRTGMDYLVMENCILEKTAQKPLHEEGDWRRKFELD